MSAYPKISDDSDPDSPSCAVAPPIQRNRATSLSAATGNATTGNQNTRKPLSIGELRAQLKAQQQRNQAGTVSVIATTWRGESCAVALPMEHNYATTLIAEFMEIDNLSLKEATRLAMGCESIRPAIEWLAMINELDELVDEFCRVFRLSVYAQGRILEARNRQSLFSIAHSLDWLRRELGKTGGVEGG